MMAIDYQALIQKQMAKPGLRGKINAYCVSCIYDGQAPGNWKQQVTACTVTDCPLYSVRPVSEGGKGPESGPNGDL